MVKFSLPTSGDVTQTVTSDTPTRTSPSEGDRDTLTETISVTIDYDHFIPSTVTAGGRLLFVQLGKGIIIKSRNTRGKKDKKVNLRT